MLLILLITFPLVLAALAMAVPWVRIRSLLLPVSGVLHLSLSIYLAGHSTPVTSDWIGLDALSTLALLVTSVLYTSCSIYAVNYLIMHTERGHRLMVGCLLIFLSAMTLAITSRHLGVLWFAAEAGSFVSAPMVYFNRNRLSIEATWKYLINSAVSIAFSMLGILFIAYAAVKGGAPPDLGIETLLANGDLLESHWMRAGFAFYAVGFASKMGLVPLHMWKPDTYGEASGLVGALMAGGLTIVAFLAMLRGVQIMTVAGEVALAKNILLGFGLLSVVTAAISMVKQPDIKRLLAYSSVEHMGILAIGIGIGGLATYGALLHMVLNCMSKGAMFLCAGNIQRAYGSKRYPEVSGTLSALPVSGSIFFAGFIALTGSLPFGLFFSELIILKEAIFQGSYATAVILLCALGTIFIGICQTTLGISMGRKDKAELHFHDEVSMVIPPLVMILAVLLIGLYLPPPLHELLTQAAALLETGP